MECAVCYTNTSSCNLVCGHSFCRDCVKSWYYKSECDPTCPMCRSKMYFKGMYKIVPKWEEDRLQKVQEEAFAEVFDNIIESDSSSEWSSDWSFDTDSEDDDDWFPENWFREDSRMYELIDMQERFKTLMRSGKLGPTAPS